jgi:regulation of enolase protein 1 (concanavalin A-like superfamily)
MRTIEFPGVKLEWIVPPASWQRDGRGVTVVAAPRTDIFINPVDGDTTVSAARALTSVPDRPWQFGARIGVDFRSAWDAGALRQFVLDERVPVRVGIEVQSPIGDGCTVTFDNLTLSDTHLTNIFDGT